MVWGRVSAGSAGASRGSAWWPGNHPKGFSLATILCQGRRRRWDNNQLYTPDGNGSECGGNGQMANGDSVGRWPTDGELIALAKQKLGMA